MSLTNELHEAVLDEVPVSRLVRMALVLATRLKDEGKVVWCQNELNGYKDGKDVPEYRALHGELYGSDAWGRRQPCIITDSPKKAEQLTRCPFVYPIAEIESMVNGGSKALQVSFHPEDEQHLLKVFEGATKVFRIVQISRCRTILDAVRQNVFEWTLALQEKGLDVAGSFGGEKRRITEGVEAMTGKAQTIQAGNVFQIGEISSSPFQVQPVASPQTATYENLDIAAISELIGDLSKTLTPAKSPELEELKSEVETLRQLLAAPKKKHGWIADGLGSVRRILEDAAGNLAAEGIKAAPYVDQITKILGLR